MKRYQTTLILTLLTLLVTACGSDSGGGTTPPGPDPGPEPIAAPGKASLTLPENNKPCETGEVSGATASVIFTWSTGEDTESFDLAITNSDTNQVTNRTNLTITTATVPLTRGHRYQWKVTSKNKGTQTTASDTYKFYLAADGEENAAPFSAEAIAPQPGSSVTVSENNTVTLEWEAADPDSDTLTYTLHIDTVDGRQEATENNQNLTTNTKEVAVESGTIYYWSVTTSDGSISVNSDVFSFRVD
jgi:hypothetical protein